MKLLNAVGSYRNKETREFAAVGIKEERSPSLLSGFPSESPLILRKQDLKVA